MKDRKTQVSMANLVSRAQVSRASIDGRDCLVVWLSGRTTPDVETFQPQGLHFRVPEGAEGILVSPGGQSSNAVIVSPHDRNGLPPESLEPGTGGLHYLGDYKVFLNDDGHVCLGAVEPGDFVALASLADNEIERINTAFTNLKSAIASGLSAVGVGAAANGPAGATAFNSASGSVPGTASPVGSLVVRSD